MNFRRKFIQINADQNANEVNGINEMYNGVGERSIWGEV